MLRQTLISAARTICLAVSAIGAVAAVILAFAGDDHGIRRQISFEPATAQYPRNLMAPRVVGDVRMGGTVRCTRGRWDDGPARHFATTHRWRLDDQDLAGQTTASHQVTFADLGHRLSCVVTAASEDASSEAVASVWPLPRNRVAPNISGDPRLDGRVHCSRGAWDERDDAPYSVTYRWRRASGTLILGANSPDYVIGRADMGVNVYCEAVAEGLAVGTSQAVQVVPGGLQRPPISGDPRVGGTLHCGRGDWDEIHPSAYGITYRWLRNDSVVPDHNTVDYAVELADLGRSIRCVVRAEGITDQSSDAVTVAPGLRSQPQISGDPRLGGTLTCTRGIWNERDGAAAYDTAFRWLRDGTPLADEFHDTYRVTRQDLGHALTCRVTVAGLAAADSLTVQPIPRQRLAPSLDGDPRLGGVLRCGRGTWDERSDSPYTVRYQWARDWSFITGETTNRYVIQRGDLGHTLECLAVAEDLTGVWSQTVAVDVVARANPTLSGGTTVGQTLTCSRGRWDERSDTPYAITFNWYRDGAAITGATAQTYKSAAPDVNRSIGCSATAEQRATISSQWVTIRASAQVTSGGAPVNIEPPVIDGDPHLGDELTCSRGTWDEPSGTPYDVTRTWYRDYPSQDVPAIGTGATYRVVAADLGRSLYCVAETQGVKALGSLGVPVPRVIVEPQVTGDPRIGRTLTCSRGLWNDDADDPYDVTFRWYASYPFWDAPDPIDSGADHVVRGSEAGLTIYCLVEAAGAGRTVAAQYISLPRTDVDPQISGDNRLGGTLTCSRGTWDDNPGTAYPVTYAWYRDGWPYNNEPMDALSTSSAMTLTTADLGHTIYCVVSAFAGRAVATRSIPAPQASVAPQISGEPRRGHTLSCDRGQWDERPGSPLAVTLSWYRDWPYSSDAVVIDTGSTHVVQDADLGRSLYCTADAPGGGRGVGALNVPPPTPRSRPSIADDPRIGIAIGCTPGDWNDEPGARYAHSYTWFRDWPYDYNDNRLGTLPTYTPEAADVGHALFCVEGAPAGATSTSDSRYVRPPENQIVPEISGEPRVGGRLSCSRGDWDDEEDARYPVTFAWYRGWEWDERNRITTDLSDHHRVVPQDIDQRIVCAVTAGGFTRATSEAVYGQDAVPTIASAVSDDQPQPGGSVGITITITNPSRSAVYISALRYRPYAGASFRAGSATGETTSDPANDEGEWLWYVYREIPPGGGLEERFTVDLPAGTADLTDRPRADTGWAFQHIGILSLEFHVDKLSRPLL